MKLATIRSKNSSTIALVDTTSSQIRYLDLRAANSTLPRTLKETFTLPEWETSISSAGEKALAQGLYLEGTLTAPVPQPEKVICIGLNYRDHAAESGADIPTEPVCFNKFPSAILAPEKPIVLPKVASKVDYEAELVIVIGKPGKHISAESARDHIAGYMNGHDVSARDWQIGRPGGQWLMGKTPDTFAPIGPWIVTKDEIPDPHSLQVTFRLNGEVMQQSSTAEFIFPVEHLISHISQLVTLSAGDLIFTGTPPGVGFARKPPRFLREGDICEVEIEGLGILKNPVLEES